MMCFRYWQTKCIIRIFVRRFWLDIGTFNQYRQAQFDLLTKSYKYLFLYGSITDGMDGRRVTIGKGTKIHGPSFIGEGVKIGTGAVIEPYSIIGKNSIVSSYSHLQKYCFCECPHWEVL